MKNMIAAFVRSLRPRSSSTSPSLQHSTYKAPPPNPNRDFKAAFEGAGVTGFENFN